MSGLHWLAAGSRATLTSAPVDRLYSTTCLRQLRRFRSFVVEICKRELVLLVDGLL
jgi:hypothetical protein